MSKRLTAEDARESLAVHLAAKGAEVHLKYGPRIGWDQLLLLLQDRSCARYPCEIQFQAGPLLCGEFAYPAPQGEAPEEGFIIFVHPRFAADLDLVPALVLYHLARVNYGAYATADDAEAFGAAALGLSKDDYYDRLCALADQLSTGAPIP